MELTTEQSAAVQGWVDAGDSISDVQKKLSAEFGLSMTYMDVRFLLDDLGAALKDSESPRAAAVDLSDPNLGMQGDGGAAASGGVSVEVDRVTKAGAVASGSVVFSDGMQATWALDAMGRLALGASQEGYKPSEEDIRAFQEALSGQLRNKGL